MGGSNWSDDHYRERSRLRARTGSSAFVHDYDVKAGQAAARVHRQMDPLGVRVRESRDSDAHPTAHAVAVLMDVTGSMGQVPIILQANLPKLMGLLIRRGYLEHPQILIGGIGDATCDRAPLQVGQFESGIEIEDDLGKLYIEGGGGGQTTESYELALYFMARHTGIDCFEKRGRRGYLFVIGDEMPYPKVKPKEVAEVIGDGLREDIPTPALIRELERMYHVYYILPRLTCYWDNPVVHRRWVELLGQNVLRLEDPAGICEMIASTIGVAEGVVDPWRVEEDLKAAGSDAVIARAVGKALGTTVKGHRDEGPVAALPDSGAGSGLTTF
jgi:hypothetical protein